MYKANEQIKQKQKNRYREQIVGCHRGVDVGEMNKKLRGIRDTNFQ